MMPDNQIDPPESSGFAATITATQFDNGNFKVTVEYGDGTNTVTDTYDMGDPAQLDQTIANRIDQLNAVTDAMSSIATGPYSRPALQPTPVVQEPPEPNPKQVAFQAALLTLRRLGPLVDLKVITSAEPAYSTALAAAQANYDPSFVP